jgi:predicted dienelactone hydrolase
MHVGDHTMNSHCHKIDNGYFWKCAMTLYSHKRAILASIVGVNMEADFDVVRSTQSSFAAWLVADMTNKDLDTNRNLQVWYYWHRFYRVN